MAPSNSFVTFWVPVIPSTDWQTNSQDRLLSRRQTTCEQCRTWCRHAFYASVTVRTVPAGMLFSGCLCKQNILETACDEFTNWCSRGLGWTDETLRWQGQRSGSQQSHIWSLGGVVSHLSPEFMDSLNETYHIYTFPGPHDTGIFKFIGLKVRVTNSICETVLFLWRNSS